MSDSARASRRIPATVLGATGYVGGEILRLLASHPQLDLVAAVSDSRAGEPIAGVFPHLAAAYGARRFVAHEDWIEHAADRPELALFSAAPHGASARVIDAALALAKSRGIEAHVVDSSADFRFPDREAFEAVYGGEHGAPGLFEAFTSGVPEHVSGTPAAHVGHPGCFATAILLAALPLLQSGLSDGEFFVTGVTGSTGSGRSPGPGTHHPERHSNLYAYKALAHRHAPEVVALAEAATGMRPRLHFVPHSGPFARGIYVTLQARAGDGATVRSLTDAYESAYAGMPFVQVGEEIPRLKDVVASNRCRIGVFVNGGSIVVFSAIDNLVKGAAGGAIQWMNRLWGLPETNGLEQAAPAWT
jgi:N-acetyl-gamma-glutamyl-phosphate reductase common form